LEVTFPAERLVERAWRHPSELARLPSNVRESIERLRKELDPDTGPVEWKRVRERRKRAAARISAMERYAAASSCRRRELLRYFGERLQKCAGCDQHPRR
jgi:superfamily II DNA helicase RecQ